MISRYTEPMATDLRDQLQALLRATPRTKSDLARVVGMHPSAIAQFLSGRSDMTATRLAALVAEAGGELVILSAHAREAMPLLALEGEDRRSILRLAEAMPDLDAATRESVTAMIAFASDRAAVSRGRRARG